MLEGKGITKAFGGLMALRDVSFRVEQGEIVGLIGPNGAGKTTLFNVISGMVRPDAGTLSFMGASLLAKAPHEICWSGVGRTFQLVKPFDEMSALENVLVGVLYGKRRPLALGEAADRALRWLEYVEFQATSSTLAKDLSLLNRKRLEMARALATEPRIVLLDEVMAGLNPTESLRAIDLIGKIHEKLGLPILVVEHVMKVIMGVSKRIMVLHHGEKIADGRPEEVVRDALVVQAYLGDGAHAGR